MFKHLDFLQNDWTLQLRKNWIPKVERKLKQKTGRKESPLVKEHSQGSIPCPIGNISGIHDIFLEAIAGSSRKCWLRCYLWSECQCSRGWSDAISFTSNFKFKMWTLIKDSNNLRSYEEHPRQSVGIEFLVCSYSVLSPHKVSFFWVPSSDLIFVAIGRTSAAVETISFRKDAMRHTPSLRAGVFCLVKDRYKCHKIQ